MFRNLKFWISNRSSCDVVGGTPDTLIGTNTTIRVESLTGDDSIRIDGHVIGLISLQNTLINADDGPVDGNIEARDVIIAGEVNGNIRCTNSINIISTAKINGDVSGASIIIDEGAIINGKYTIRDPGKDFSFTPVVRTNGLHIVE